MLRFEQLSVRFGSITALRDVTCPVTQGCVTVVIGPNAAGKSTLLRCAGGAQRPTDGAALLDDRPVHSTPPRMLARRLAYVSQRPTVAAAFTVREVVQLGRYALPSRTGVVMDAMQRLDLADLANRIVPTLSIGQQQRVAVARALAQHEPGGVIVLDEPTSAMDLRHTETCMQQLRELASSGATVLLSLHDLTLAATVADDVMLLDAGRLIEHGPVEQVMTPDTLSAVFGVPFEMASRADGSRTLLPLPRLSR